jgi:hypothetical protein
VLCRPEGACGLAPIRQLNDVIAEGDGTHHAIGTNHESGVAGRSNRVSHEYLQTAIAQTIVALAESENLT